MDTNGLPILTSKGIDAYRGALHVGTNKKCKGMSNGGKK